MRKTKIESLKTRQYLMNAALEVFYRQGVTRATLQEIAQEAGVTRGALYWHFRNKEDLFEAMFGNFYNDVLARLQPDVVRQADDAWQYLRDNLCDTLLFLASNETHQKFCSVITDKCERTSHNETILALSKKYHDCLFQNVGVALQLCVEQKKLPENLNLHLATVYLKSTISGMIKMWLAYPEEIDLKKIVQPFLDTSLNALLHSPHLLKA